MPFCPVGVIDLCDMDELPVEAEKSKNDLLDLCNSDPEERVKPTASGAKAAASPLIDSKIPSMRNSVASSPSPRSKGGMGAVSKGYEVAAAKPVETIKPETPAQLLRGPETTLPLKRIHDGLSLAIKKEVVFVPGTRG